MDDGQSMTRGDLAHQQRCQPAQNSSTISTSVMRGNQYYDPVHESREWHQSNSNTPGQLSQITHISSSSWTLPSLIAYQSSSHHTHQELPYPSSQSQDTDPYTQTSTSSDGFRDNLNTQNTTHYTTGPYHFVRTSEPESLLVHSRQVIATSSVNSGTTSSNFVSPMFLSNSELAIIDTRRSQRNSTRTNQNLHLPHNILSSPGLGNIVSTQQTLNVNYPSEVGSRSSQGSSHSRRRNRLHTVNSREENVHSHGNENIVLQRREYEVAFGASIIDGEPSLTATRGAFIRRPVAAKRVPSREAMASLETVKLEELEENDRSCIICYNEFAVENPEGIIEMPLRLPKCKHIFGDKCIKKWFEDSDSCPYCRDKLPSEISFKKICGYDSSRETRERINAFRQRIRHDTITGRYISTVNLPNARFPPTTQSSSISESTRFPVIGGSSSLVNNLHWHNLSTNRSSAADSSERRRYLRSRGSSPRSTYHLSRQSTLAPSRANNLILPVPPFTGTSSQVPNGNSLSSFNPNDQNYAGASRGGRTQEIMTYGSPTTWQLSESGGSTPTYSESSPPIVNSGYNTSLTIQERMDRLNEVQNEMRIEMRNEMRRSLEDVSLSIQTDFANNDLARSSHEEFPDFPYFQHHTEIETQRFVPLYTSHWHIENNDQIENVSMVSSNMYGDRSVDVRSDELMTNLSQSPPQTVA